MQIPSGHPFHPYLSLTSVSVLLLGCSDVRYFYHLMGSSTRLEVTVSKDVPGFVSNALLMPFINEGRISLGFLHPVWLTSLPRPVS